MKVSMISSQLAMKLAMSAIVAVTKAIVKAIVSTLVTIMYPPRGYYMLFILNAKGVPSEGKFIHLH